MTDDELRDLLPTLISDAVREATRQQDLTPRFRQGEVTAVAAEVATVLMDGDADPVHAIIAGSVAVADRVLVVFTDKGGAWTLGATGGGGPGDCLCVPMPTCDYGVYTKIGDDVVWSCPPTPFHIWSGSGWVLADITVRQDVDVADVFTPAAFVGTDTMTVSVVVPPVAPTVIDVFTPAAFAATESIIVPGTPLASDTFDRAASGTVGFTDGTGALDPRQWTEHLGNWGVGANVLTNNGPAVGVSIITIDPGVSYGDGDLRFGTIDPGAIAGAGVGAVFRYTDTAHYLFAVQRTNGNYELWKNDTGVLTMLNIATGFPSVTPTAMRVTYSGSNITVYRNGVSVITATDAFNATAHRCGGYSDDLTTISPTAFLWNDFALYAF